MAVVGEPMEEYVLLQIQARQRFAGKLNRDNDHHKFTTSRTAWVKLASGVTLKTGSKFGGGMTYAQKYVLFNGTSTNGTTLRKGIGPEKSYDTSDKDFGVVPMPGIIDASIKALNRGSIKKATIKIKANSRRQFEILDELYLRVGYNMLLEWGHTHLLTGEYNGNYTYSMMGSTLIETDWFKSEEYPGSTEDWLRNIRDMRHQYQGNYDAMFGRVVNFKWDFNDDGTYDIELFLISHGDIIESLRTLPSSLSHPQINEKKGNPFSRYWEDYGKKILEFAKNKKILENATYSTSLCSFASKDYSLDTSGVRDKLTEYLYAVAFYGFGVASNMFVYGSAGSPSRFFYPFRITTYKPSGYPIIKWGYGLYDPANAAGLMHELYSGHAYGASSNRSSTCTGLEGIVSYSVDNYTQKKQKIVESLVAWDGGFHGGNTWYNSESSFTLGDYTGQDNTTMKSKITFNYSPISDPYQRSYIRLGNLLEALQLFCIPYEENAEKPVLSIETNKVIPMYVPPEHQGYDQKMYCTYHSAKPKTVIGVRNSCNFLYYDRESNPPSWASQNHEMRIFLGAEECIENYNISLPANEHHCFMRAENLYISIPYIMDIIPISKNDGNDVRLNLYKLLKDICQEINQAFGGVNNLEPVLDENTNTLRLQDSTNFPERNGLFEHLKLSRWGEEDDWMGDPVDETIFDPIQVYGYRNTKGPVASFVRKINLQTKISKELAALSVIGSTANGSTPGLDATALSRFNKGKINRFATNFTYNLEEDIIPIVPFWKQYGELLYPSNNSIYPDCSTMLGYQSYSLKNRKIGAMENEEGNKESSEIIMSSDVQSSNIILFHNVWNENSGLLYKDKAAGSPSIGFLPFEFSLDMDGLSGIKIYNKINVDTTFLPHYYSSTMEFVIKGVEHKLSNNDWVTTVQTISVPKTADISIPSSTGINVGPSGASPHGGGTPPDPNTIIKWIVDGVPASAGNSAMNITSNPGYRGRNRNTVLLIEEMKTQGVTNPVAIVAWLSICSKESGFRDDKMGGEDLHHEGGPDAKRAKWFWDKFRAIRKIYKNMLGSSTTKTSPAYITKFTDIYKNNPDRIFDQIYGNEAYDVGVHDWNDFGGDDPPRAGDGKTYIGRGYNQTTFKEGYDQAGRYNGDKDLFIDKRKGVSVGGDPLKLGKQPFAKITSTKEFISRMTDSNAKPRNGVLAKDYNSWTEADMMTAIELAAWGNAGWGNTWSVINSDGDEIGAKAHADSAKTSYNLFGFGNTWL